MSYTHMIVGVSHLSCHHNYNACLKLFNIVSVPVQHGIHYKIHHNRRNNIIANVIHNNHDLRKMFMTLLLNDQQSFCCTIFISFPFFFVYIKFQSIASLLSYSIIMSWLTLWVMTLKYKTIIHYKVIIWNITMLFYHTCNYNHKKKTSFVVWKTKWFHLSWTERQNDL